MFFKKGDTMQVVSPSLNIMAKSKVSFEFPIDFGVYNLPQFISLIDLDIERELDFKDTHVEVVGKYSRVKYFYTELSLMSESSKFYDIELPSCDATFKLNEDVLLKAIKQASILNQDQLKFEYDGKLLLMKTLDNKRSTSNEFRYELELELVNASIKHFEFIFDVSNIVFIPGNYVVNLSKSKFAEFIGDKVSYIIAGDTDSNFGE